MMILVLIIIIAQRNSPQNRNLIFISNTIKLNWIKEKEIIQIVIIHFPPLLTHPSLLTLFSFVSPLPNNGQQQKYVYLCKDACQYIRKSNSTYTNILTFNSTQT